MRGGNSMVYGYEKLSAADKKRLKEILGSEEDPYIYGTLFYDRSVDYFCLKPPDCTGLIGGKKGLIPLFEGQKLEVLLDEEWVPTVVISIIVRETWRLRKIYQLQDFEVKPPLRAEIRIKAEPE